MELYCVYIRGAKICIADSPLRSVIVVFIYKTRKIRARASFVVSTSYRVDSNLDDGDDGR